MDKKNEEIKHLKEKLAMRESEIHWIREETAQRASALQSAVRNYTQPLSSSMWYLCVFDTIDVFGDI